MKYIFPLLIFLACQQPATKETELTLAESLAVADKVDSMVKESVYKALFDTIGLHAAPIKIISATLVKEEYSSYRDVRLTFKNVSNKKIQAARFKWYGLNAFNEPANMGRYGMLQGFGGGWMDRALSPGKSLSLEWDVFSNDAKKIVLAWPYEVAFADGTKWELK